MEQRSEGSGGKVYWMKPHTKERQSRTTPELALQSLRDGNDRFLSSKTRDRDLIQQVIDASEEQFPIAVTLSCIDSRTSCELIFDQGIGHIFSIRVAGSVINDEILGSMEFACKVAGSKLVVVMGHTKCGAVQAAIDDVQMGKISTIIDKIQPSVSFETTISEERNSENEEFVEKVSVIQVKRSMEAVVEESRVLRDLIKRKEIGLIGAIYDVDTGIVDFLDETYMCGQLKQLLPDEPDID